MISCVKLFSKRDYVYRSLRVQSYLIKNLKNILDQYSLSERKDKNYLHGSALMIVVSLLRVLVLFTLLSFCCKSFLIEDITVSHIALIFFGEFLLFVGGCNYS